MTWELVQEHVVPIGEAIEPMARAAAELERQWGMQPRFVATCGEAGDWLVQLWLMRPNTAATNFDEAPPEPAAADCEQVGHPDDRVPEFIGGGPGCGDTHGCGCPLPVAHSGGCGSG